VEHLITDDPLYLWLHVATKSTICDGVVPLVTGKHSDYPFVLHWLTFGVMCSMGRGGFAVCGLVVFQVFFPVLSSHHRQTQTEQQVRRTLGYCSHIYFFDHCLRAYILWPGPSLPCTPGSHNVRLHSQTSVLLVEHTSGVVLMQCTSFQISSHMPDWRGQGCTGQVCTAIGKALSSYGLQPVSIVDSVVRASERVARASNSKQACATMPKHRMQCVISSTFDGPVG
jgi:hypothetical protein